MTDKEYIENIKSLTSRELIEELEYFGCDPYYYDLWEVILKEVKCRLDAKEKKGD